MSVELGPVILEHLTRVEVSEAARMVRHAVPGMAGDLSQVLGRPSVTIRIHGIFYGAGAAGDLGALRAAYLEGKPVDFFAEAVGEGYFAQVLIAQLQVVQRAGFLDQFDYVCDVVEFVEPPAPAFADPFGVLDAELADEATTFMDDVQNSLEEVSGLVELIANLPSFGDPTRRLPQLLESYTDLTKGGVSVLAAIRDSL